MLTPIHWIFGRLRPLYRLGLGLGLLLFTTTSYAITVVNENYQWRWLAGRTFNS